MHLISTVFYILCLYIHIHIGQQHSIYNGLLPDITSPLPNDINSSELSELPETLNPFTPVTLTDEQKVHEVNVLQLILDEIDTVAWALEDGQMAKEEAGIRAEVLQDR